MVYTGDRKIKPETISLKRDIFGIDDGDDCCVEVEAKVIYGNEDSGDILNQFIIFSKVFDEQRKLYPDDIRKAVQETIRICREMNVLNDYLAEEEAATVMYAFADQEREFSKALRKERSEGKILGFVDALRDDGKSNQDIVDRLMTKYSLTQEQAEGYVKAPVTM